MHQDVIANLSTLNHTYLRAWVRTVVEHSQSLHNLFGTADVDNDTILPIPEEQRRTVVPRLHKLIRSMNSRSSFKGKIGEAAESRDASVSSYFSDDAILPTDTIPVARIDRSRKSVIAPRTEENTENSDSD